MSVRVELIAVDPDIINSSITGTQHGHGFTTPTTPLLKGDFLWCVPGTVRLGPVLLSLHSR